MRTWIELPAKLYPTRMLTTALQHEPITIDSFSDLSYFAFSFFDSSRILSWIFPSHINFTVIHYQPIRRWEIGRGRHHRRHFRTQREKRETERKERQSPINFPLSIQQQQPVPAAAAAGASSSSSSNSFLHLVSKRPRKKSSQRHRSQEKRKTGKCTHENQFEKNLFFVTCLDIRFWRVR